ncbi:Protein CBG09990 [Caenorhabditis briggsae]|uniref:Mannose-6-phosphate isomerase n=1 Tax=Caenorhabditis briggsae TaxID=6238 RepID=A8XA43_CAEBR|nr:Protein CBG09990 [Caenorhabditis briggsae]CAP29510.2 Protein CBG09990 [Caenorhabditis briggsae]
MLLKLKCTVNNYAWGAKGEASMAGNLALDGGHIANLETDKPYAEFWVGTHANGPARVIENNIALKDYFLLHPTYKESMKMVLSVVAPLSIQIHPTKKQGKVLHAKDPKNYPDDNHKPEIAIALTEFELLSGFRQHSQICEYLKLYSEIQELLTEEEKSQIDNLGSFGESSSQVLKKIFSRIWRTPKEKLQTVVDKLARRIQGQENKSALDEIIVYLFTMYPGDVGVFAPIFLNYFKLQPGEATFLEPNMPHAYLKGDCVECMADSDNTIRAGLTPKYIDVESLVEMLNYTETLLPKYIPNELDDGTLLFTPRGIDEFWVQEVKGPSGSIYQLPYSESCSVLTILYGTATVTLGNSSQTLNRGEVLFVGATHSTSERPKVNISDDFLAFRAFTPSPRALESLSNKNLIID